MKTITKHIIFYLSLALCCFACSNEPLTFNILQQDSGTDLRLYAVEFHNDSIGYAVGGRRYDRTIILRTEDAGTTWQQLPIETEKVIFSLDVYGADEFVAGDYNGKIVFSQDAGETFIAQPTNEWHPIRGLQYFNPTVIYATGGVGLDGGYIHYVNDDLRWDYHFFERELRDIHFVDEEHGFVCGFGILMESKDAARTWEPIPEVAHDFFTAMHFPDKETGYVVGYNGSVYRTSDTGQSWTKLIKGNHPFERQEHFNDVYFISPAVGMIVGDRGLAYKTEDAGENWQRVKGIDKVDLRGVYLTSESSGYIVGGNGRIFKFEE